MCEPRRQHPELRALAAEASQALSRLDADRLEELALMCRALGTELSLNLNLDLTLSLELTPAISAEHQALASQAREAAGDMAVFARVLEATRANLNVMKRLRELRAGLFEYSAAAGRGWAETESGNGDH